MKYKNNYQVKEQYIRVFALLMLFLASSSLQAVPMEPSSDQANQPTGDWMPLTNPQLDERLIAPPHLDVQLLSDRQIDKRLFAYFHMDEQYRKIVKLLQQGKRKQAKLALGIQLAREPDPHGYEIAGILFLEDGENEVALAAFEKAISLNPNSITAHARRGLTLLIMGRLEQGKNELLQVLRSQPDNALALRYLGWHQDISGRPEAAINYYQKLLKTEAYQNKKLTTIHLEVARLYNLLHQNQKAIDIIIAQEEPKRDQLAWSLRQYSLFDSYIPLSQTPKAALIIKQLEKSSFADAAEVALRKATLAQTKGEFKAAERELQQLIDTNPRYLTPATMQIAQHWIDLKMPEKAAQALKTSLAKETNLKNIKLMLRGLTSLQVDRKLFSDAKSELKKYIHKYPETPYFGYLLFEVHKIEGNQLAAMKTLRELLKRSPKFADGWYEAGLLGRNLKQDKEAEKDFQQAVILNANFTEAWIELARLLFEQRREKEMESVLKLAISRNPQSSQLPFELASLYENQGKSKQASEIYRLILQLYPDHVPSLNNLALNLAHEPKNDAEALKLASHAHKLLPTEAIPMATYGWVMLLSGDVKRALPLLEKASKIEQRDMGIQHYLAVAYLKSGRTAAAEAQIEKAGNLVGSDEQKRALKTFLTHLRSGYKFSDKELRAISY